MLLLVHLISLLTVVDQKSALLNQELIPAPVPVLVDFQKVAPGIIILISQLWQGQSYCLRKNIY